MAKRVEATDRTGTRSPTKGWNAKPAAAHAVRLAQLVLPFIAGWLAIRLMQPWFLAVPDAPAADVVLWVMQAVVVASVVSSAVSIVLQRFTPLVALLQMTLIFPDRVPSRFGLALRSSNVKQLLAAPTLQLGGSAQAAAEDAVQLVSYLSRHEPLTRGHTERVRAYADIIGQQMGLSDEDLDGLRWGALLHDIGKLAVPPEILNKPGKPTDAEWALLRQHPAAAIEILEPLEGWLGEWLRAAPDHHERWDGTGYPNGTAQREISLAGRITAVADAYDVMTSRRSYSMPRSAEDARKELVACAGSHFDPVVVRAMLEASVTRSAVAGRLGWILELPGLARLASTAGTAAASAGVAVVAVALSSGPSVDLDATEPPAEVAFVEAAPEEVPSQAAEVPPTTADPQQEVVIAGDGDAAIVVEPEPEETEDEFVPATTTVAPAATTVAPATTAALLTTTTTTTTTTAPTPCDALKAGESNLAGADLRGCDLRAVSIAGVDLQNSRLDGVDMSGALVTDFNLAGANLTGAVLTNAEFRRGSAVTARLTESSAQGLQLVEVDMASVDLQNADLQGARFVSVSFGFAHLQGANLAGSTITGTNFNDADAGSTNFSGVDLSGIEFYRTLLGDANLSNTTLTDAVFSDASGLPVGTESAIFLRTTCPNWSFGDANCW